MYYGKYDLPSDDRALLPWEKMICNWAYALGMNIDFDYNGFMVLYSESWDEEVEEAYAHCLGDALDLFAQWRSKYA